MCVCWADPPTARQQNHFCKATASVFTLSARQDFGCANLMIKASSEYFIVWTLLAAYMLCRFSLERRPSACPYLFFRSENPAPTPLPTQPIILLSPRRFLCNSKHKRRDFLGMSAGSLFRLTPECYAPFHSEEQKKQPRGQLGLAGRPV